MSKREIALVSLLVLAACKSSEKSSSATPPPTPAAAPVAPEGDTGGNQAETPPPAEPAAAAPAPAPAAEAEPGNTLVVGAPVKKGWSEGGPGEVVWKVAGGGRVTLRAESGKPEGVLVATYQGKQQHVTNFACNTANAESVAEFALTADGKVVFRAAAGARGKKPGPANAFLLEWQPDKATVFVAQSWEGSTAAEPPPWAKL